MNDLKITKNIRIELTELQVKEIIADYLKRDGYKVASCDVELSIKTKTEGLYTAEHTVPYFHAAYIKCQEK